MSEYAHKDILTMRANGMSWPKIQVALGLGSIAAARRLHEKALRLDLTSGTFDIQPPPEDPEYFAPEIFSAEPKRTFVPDVPRIDPPVFELIAGDRDTNRLNRVLFVPDAHIPYENKAAWSLMMCAAEDFKPDIIVIAGDFADFKAVSSHLKDPKDHTRLKWEMTCAKERLDELDALDATIKVYVAGNHEDRLQRYLQEKAPALFDMLNVPETLGLEARGWTYVPYKEHTEVGALYVTHDVGTAGVNSARKALDTFMHSVVTGHSHRLQYIVEGDAVGGARVSATFGWLGDINEIDYMSRAQAGRSWALGFGIGYINPSNQAVHLVPVPIVLGSVVVEGKLYSVRED